MVKLKKQNQFSKETGLLKFQRAIAAALLKKASFNSIENILVSDHFLSSDRLKCYVDSYHNNLKLQIESVFFQTIRLLTNKEKLKIFDSFSKNPPTHKTLMLDQIYGFQDFFKKQEIINRVPGLESVVDFESRLLLIMNTPQTSKDKIMTRNYEVDGLQYFVRDNLFIYESEWSLFDFLVSENLSVKNLRKLLKMKHEYLCIQVSVERQYQIHKISQAEFYFLLKKLKNIASIKFGTTRKKVAQGLVQKKILKKRIQTKK